MHCTQNSRRSQPNLSLSFSRICNQIVPEQRGWIWVVIYTVMKYILDCYINFIPVSAIVKGRSYKQTHHRVSLLTKLPPRWSGWAHIFIFFKFFSPGTSRNRLLISTRWDVFPVQYNRPIRITTDDLILTWYLVSLSTAVLRCWEWASFPFAKISYQSPCGRPLGGSAEAYQNMAVKGNRAVM